MRPFLITVNYPILLVYAQPCSINYVLPDSLTMSGRAKFVVSRPVPKTNLTYILISLYTAIDTSSLNFSVLQLGEGEGRAGSAILHLGTCLLASVLILMSKTNTNVITLIYNQIFKKKC